MTSSSDTVILELETLVARAESGDPSVLPDVRRLISEHPDIIDQFGDVARIAADL